LRNKKAAEEKEKTETKVFGMVGFIKFTWPRIWNDGCSGRLLVIINLFLVFLVKATATLVPLILKEVVDSIVCNPAQKRKDWLFNFSDRKCRTEEEVYILIGIYAFSKLLTDTINYLREIPFSYVAAKAEISIAHDVYDHVQR